jgi:hypothetical protein
MKGGAVPAVAGRCADITDGVPPSLHICTQDQGSGVASAQ